jgi:ABC-type proline/glycine betaine transport system permease subunit
MIFKDSEEYVPFIFTIYAIPSVLATVAFYHPALLRNINDIKSILIELMECVSRSGSSCMPRGCTQ